MSMRCALVTWSAGCTRSSQPHSCGEAGRWACPSTTLFQTCF
jgi:hypothetical protein